MTPAPRTMIGHRGEACDFIPTFFEHLEENRRLTKALLGSSLSVHVVREHVQGQIFRHFKRSLGARPGEAALKVEAAAVFASGALLAMMHWWVGLEQPASRAKVAQLFRMILEPGLKAVERTS